MQLVDFPEENQVSDFYGLGLKEEWRILPVLCQDRSPGSHLSDNQMSTKVNNSYAATVNILKGFFGPIVLLPLGKKYCP